MSWICLSSNPRQETLTSSECEFPMSARLLLLSVDAQTLGLTEVCLGAQIGYNTVFHLPWCQKTVLVTQMSHLKTTCCFVTLCSNLSRFAEQAVQSNSLLNQWSREYSPGCILSCCNRSLRRRWWGELGCNRRCLTAGQVFCCVTHPESQLCAVFRDSSGSHST